MKLLISNQHGAIVMALLPFLYGMLLGNPVAEHAWLLAAWSFLYLMTYPFLSLFKGKNLTEYRKWTIIYGALSALFAIPALFYNWRVIYFGLAMLPLVALAIYFTKKRDERNLLNDFAGILIFSLAGMAAYYFSTNAWDEKIYWVALYPTLFFVGTTLYVKSMLRERKNPRYLRASIIYHGFCVLPFLFLNLNWLALAYGVPLLRAVLLPQKKLSVKQVGLTEFLISAMFFAFLLIATL